MAQKNRVTLEVDGFSPREVAAVTYAFTQEIGKDNDPTGIPRGGKISMRIKAEDSGNAELLKWMTSKTMAKKRYYYLYDCKRHREENESGRI